MTDIETKLTADASKDVEGGTMGEKNQDATDNLVDSSEDSFPLKKEHKNYEDEKEVFDLEKFPVRQVEFIPRGFSEAVAFNPVVSGMAIAFLWGLAIWSIGKSDRTAILLRHQAMTTPHTYMYLLSYYYS